MSPAGEKSYPTGSEAYVSSFSHISWSFKHCVLCELSEHHNHIMVPGPFLYTRISQGFQAQFTLYYFTRDRYEDFEDSGDFEDSDFDTMQSSSEITISRHLDLKKLDSCSLCAKHKQHVHAIDTEESSHKTPLGTEGRIEYTLLTRNVAEANVESMLHSYIRDRFGHMDGECSISQANIEMETDECVIGTTTVLFHLGAHDHDLNLPTFHNLESIDKLSCILCTQKQRHVHAASSVEMYPGKSLLRFDIRYPAKGDDHKQTVASYVFSHLFGREEPPPLLETNGSAEAPMTRTHTLFGG